MESARGILTPMRSSLSSPRLASLVRSVLLTEAASDRNDEGEDEVDHPLHDRAHAIAQTLQDPAALRAAASQETMIGRGGNATVHSILGEDDLVLRVERVGGFSGEESYVLPGASRVANPYGDMNVGQPLARVGRATVLLRQRGVPAGMTKSEPAYRQEDRDRVYRARVKLAARMPQEAYDRAAADLLRANGVGMCWDPSKSNNVLIDRQGGRFGLVDLSPCHGTYRNSAAELIICLVGNTHAEKDIRSTRLLRDDRREIVLRALRAARSVGLPISSGARGPRDDSGLAYSLSLSGLTFRELGL
jgi:hypothetical protein